MFVHELVYGTLYELDFT